MNSPERTWWPCTDVDGLEAFVPLTGPPEARQHRAGDELDSVFGRLIYHYASSGLQSAESSVSPNGANASAVYSRDALVFEIQAWFDDRATVERFAAALAAADLDQVESVVGARVGALLDIWAIADEMSPADRMRLYDVEAALILDHPSVHMHFHLIRRQGAPLHQLFVPPLGASVFGTSRRGTHA